MERKRRGKGIDFAAYSALRVKKLVLPLLDSIEVEKEVNILRYVSFSNLSEDSSS